MRNTIFMITMLLTAVLPVRARQELAVNGEGGSFALCVGGKVSAVSVSDKETPTVKRIAQLFADDVCLVTGKRPVVTNKNGKGSVIIATLGSNTYIDQLVKKGRLDVSAIRGGWEQFVIRVVDGRLLIVGSDRRGAAYGAFTLSEQMGVSPWYWWADVPVVRRDAVFVTADYTSAAPTVKYRGIFINDEDWGLKPWASKNYERQLGDIGPRTYARVCELLLRLKANMLAPAMHSCTGAFYNHPESKVVCDSFGIIITTSHCEPLLLNNAAKSEWDSKRDGEWNYKTNRDVIWKKWDDRLSEASQYENIYTTAMRGVHDEGLRGSLPMEERVPLIEKVISEQRELLTSHLSPLTPESIPQIFVPYKETMDIYENGLRVPDDITLVWVDDNYGYMKRVSSPEEQRRSGRSGVYYHLSYLGAPHDYLWLNTTPPVLMYEELKKAYDHGADRYWLLNVGDIKPMELGLQTFFDMAWDINSFSFEKANTHQANFLTKLFSNLTFPSAVDRWFSPLTSHLQQILDAYYRLAWSRKPEFMGFEYQWDDKAHTGLKDTEFSYSNGDAQRRLADYQRISDLVALYADSLRRSLSYADTLRLSFSYADTLRLSFSYADTLCQSFFQLLQFPVQAAYQMNRKFLMAQLNHEMAAAGMKAEANWAARQMDEAYDSINALNRRYNKQLGGKWDGMMALPTSFTNTCEYYKKPEVSRFEGVGETPVDLTPSSSLTSPLSLLSSQFPISHKDDGVTIVNGLGYDWKVVLLNSGSISYTVPALDTDTIEIELCTVPFWPIYKGKSNRVGISIDGSQQQVFENRFKEYDRTWKDQVMCNGAFRRFRFPVDRTLSSHTITLTTIDPGQMVQRLRVL